MRRLMFVVALLCVLSLSSIAQARYPYPEYRNDDRNFPLVWGHDGTAFYIDRSSIEISRQSDTVLVAAINVLTVDERGTEYRSNITDGTVTQKQMFAFAYDESNLSMYNYDENKDELVPVLPLARGVVHYSGEALYYIVTGKKFHGARKWRRENSNEYLTMFDNVFYARY